jgi:predicted nucleic acid-binding protein
MAAYMPDTNCMVAAVCTWHEHHAAASTELEVRLGRGERLVIAGPALVETYSVLTRLPPPHRLSARDAYALIAANFVEGRDVVALDADDYRRIIELASLEEIGGGQVYDAVLAACARGAAVDAFLTFNARHFDRYRSPGLAIVVPGRP